MSHAILRCEDLTICYHQRPAVHHLSVAFPCGALVGIVGPNGAGKSTLLQGMLGWLPWTSGRVTLDGKPVLACAGRVSYLAQRRTQDQDFPADVESVVAMGRYACRGLFGGVTAEDQAVIDGAIAEMGLYPKADNFIKLICVGARWRNCPAGSSSESSSPAPWLLARTSCCWMSRLPDSMNSRPVI